MKKILFLLLCVSAACFGAEAKFKRIPTAEKIKRPGQTFALTFDSITTVADYASGSTSNIGQHRNLALGLRGIIGFDRRNAFRAENDEVLKFNVPKNLNPAQGTISFWVRAVNYNQNDQKQKRGNIGFFEFVNGSGKNQSVLQIYDYNGLTCATWKCPLPRVNRTIKVQTAKCGIKPGEFYQIVLTWDLQKIAIYINGELGELNQFPAGADDFLKMKPTENAYFAVRPRIWDDKNKFQVEIDDFYIYDTAKTPTWIRKNYRDLLSGKYRKPVVSFDFTVNGIDRGNGSKSTKSELDFDFSLLETELNNIDSLTVNVTSPKGKKTSRVFKKVNAKEIIEFDSSVPGKYQVSAVLKRKKGEQEKINRTIVIPDTSFYGNKIGAEDTVPKPWIRPEIKGRSISVWNRVYEFDNGPFPKQIFVKGRKMLVEAPSLKFKPALNFKWTAGKITRNNCEIILRGSGKAGKITADYQTKVTFDGVVITDITINGKPAVNGMDLEWQLDKRFSKYLKTPTVVESNRNPYKFKFVKQTPHYIHLTSREGGFAFNYESDANWVYDPEEKIFSANRKTGKCQVNLITKKVTIPEKTSYRFIFTATPTRAFPEKIRGLRMYDYRHPEMKEFLDSNSKAFTAIASFKPTPDFEKVMLGMKNAAPGRYIYYSMADAQMENDPVIKHFQKYWDIPFRYRYMMHGNMTCSTCPATGLNDYLLANQKELWAQPLSNRFYMAYYDLCGVSACQNALHGCVFKDNFGRTIFRNNLLSKRDLILRTLRYGQKFNKPLMLHAQRWYYPPLHGLADYWYPGEEHGSLLRNNNYAYTDEIPDLVWKTEFDREVIGTAVVMCPSSGWSRKSQIFEYGPTNALMAAVLPYDVEIGGGYRNTGLTGPVMLAYEQLGVYGPQKDVVFNRFDRQKELIISDDECRISYYRVKGKRTVAVAANMSPMTKNITVRIKNGVMPANGQILDCITNELIPVKDNVFKLTIPSRSVRILTGYEGRKIDKSVPCINSAYSNRVRVFEDFNKDKNPCIRLDIAAGKGRAGGSGLIFNKKPAGDHITLEMEIKAEGIEDDALVSFSIQPRKTHNRMIKGLYAPIGGSRRFKASQCRDWKKVTISGKMPVHKDFNEVLLVLSGAASEKGSIFFRNIKITGSAKKNEKYR